MSSKLSIDPPQCCLFQHACETMKHNEQYSDHYACGTKYLNFPLGSLIPWEYYRWTGEISFVE